MNCSVLSFLRSSSLWLQVRVLYPVRHCVEEPCLHIQALLSLYLHVHEYGGLVLEGVGE
jgi:hypothetical protein